MIYIGEVGDNDPTIEGGEICVADKKISPFSFTEKQFNNTKKVVLDESLREVVKRGEIILFTYHKNKKFMYGYYDMMTPASLKLYRVPAL